jgi:hypothetical protein
MPTRSLQNRSVRSWLAHAPLFVEEGSLAGWRMEMRAASLPDKSGKKATRM